MRQTSFTLALLTASILAGCGGSTGGDQTLKNKYSAQVSFGDSLSDVGTYAVGTVAALGGGKFTVNGDNTAANAALTGKNWTELMAAQFSLPAPCPAQTGLDGNAAQGFSVPVVNHAGCYGYAQGGARVSNPVGTSNKLTGSALGALTVPVTTQVKNHLAAVGGKFKGDEIVFVLAGANDILALLNGFKTAATAAGTSAFGTSLVGLLAAGATNPATAAQAIGLALATENARTGHTDTSVVTAAVTAAATQAGNSAVAAPTVYGPLVTQAQAAGAKAGADYATANGPKLIPAISAVADELVTLVKTQMLANGAKYVAVNNLPDVASTPSGLAQDASARALIAAMVTAFNNQLNTGLGNTAGVTVIDVYAVSHDQTINPGPYGLTNVTDTACDLSAAKNPLSSSLTCKASNLKSGDVSHYAYADELHPTPFNNLLLARYIAEKLVVKGWM